MPLNDPVPSKALDVFERNTEDTDRFVNSEDASFTNRVGFSRKTLSEIERQGDSVIQEVETNGAAAIAEIEELAQVAVDGVGYDYLDPLTFETGATITNANQALLWASADGGNDSYYRWAGALDKTVPAGSTPADSGGVATGAWRFLGDAALRDQLADGTADVGGVSAKDLANPPIPTLLTPVSHIYDRSDDRIYNAWPFDNLHYDAANDCVIFIYTSADAHLIPGSSADIVFRKQLKGVNPGVDGDTLDFAWSDRVVICTSSEFPPDGLPTCHASFITPNGDYVALIRIRYVTADTETYLFRSTDAGDSWTNEGLWRDTAGNEIVLGGAGSTEAAGGSPHGSKIIDGRIYIFGWDTRSGYDVRIYLSDSASGANESYYFADTVDLPASGMSNYTPLEGAFIKNPDNGNIILYARGGQGAEDRNLVYSVSTDEGLTWADWQISNVVNAKSSPCAFIPYNDFVEVFWTDRTTNSYTRQGSIYQGRATYAELEAGEVNHFNKIGNMGPNKDSGYIAAVKTDNDDVYVAYYGGINDWSAIFLMSGTRDKYKPQPYQNNSGLIATGLVGASRYRIYNDGEMVERIAANVDVGSGTLQLFDTMFAHREHVTSVSVNPSESMGSSERLAWSSHSVFYSRSDGFTGAVGIQIHDPDPDPAFADYEITIEVRSNIYTNS